MGFKALAAPFAATAIALYAAAIPASASPARPLTTNPPCQARTDFYRLISTTGQFCFANKGMLSVYIQNVQEICAGDNTGRILYDNSQWSPLRGPGGCWPFQGTVTANKVQIN